MFSNYQQLMSKSTQNGLAELTNFQSNCNFTQANTTCNKESETKSESLKINEEPLDQSKDFSVDKYFNF